MFSISIKKTAKVSYVLFYCLEITTVNCLRLKKHFLICMISLITCTFYSWFLILHLILFFPFRNIHHYSILGEVIFNECTTRPDVSKRYPIVYFQTQFSHSISSPFLGAFPLWIVTPNIWDSSLPVLFLLYPHSVHQEIMLALPSKYIQSPTMARFFCDHRGPSSIVFEMFHLYPGDILNSAVWVTVVTRIDVFSPSESFVSLPYLVTV